MLQGVPTPMWIYPQVTVPLIYVHTGVQSVQYISRGRAIMPWTSARQNGQKMVPGTAEYDNKWYSNQQNQKAITDKHWTQYKVRKARPMASTGV